MSLTLGKQVTTRPVHTTITKTIFKHHVNLLIRSLLETSKFIQNNKASQQSRIICNLIRVFAINQ